MNSRGQFVQQVEASVKNKGRTSLIQKGNLLSKEVGIKNVSGVDTPQPEYAKYQWTYYVAGDQNQFLLESAIDANGRAG